MATNLNLPTKARQIGGTTKTTLNARDLHARLGIAARFNDWIIRRISQYGFEAGQDFVYSDSSSGENQALSEKFGNLIAGRNRKDYFITTEMAKELALVENNPQGRAIRKALIRMEEKMQAEIPALIANLQKELLAARPDWQKISRYEAMGLTHNEIARLSGITSTTVRDKLKRMSRCKLVQYKPDPRLAAQGRKGMQALQQRLALEGGES